MGAMGMVINELPQVLMWRETASFEQTTQELWVAHGKNADGPGLSFEKSKEHLFDIIKTKEEFIRRIEDYAANATPTWSDQASPHCDVIIREDMDSGLPYATPETGAQRHELYTKAASGWAMHLQAYGQAVNNQDGQYILELATGAGMGLWAVVKDFPAFPTSRLVSIDIDYPCTRNAEGIARYFNVADRVGGLPANFWFLPFAGEMFDCVCTHYGLDESREIQRTLQEVSRVLLPGGRFVVVARKNPYDRQGQYMSMFNISADECNPLLKKARLYSGPDNLITTAQTHDLILVNKTVYKPENGHHRVLLVFQKQGAYAIQT